ncbi:MAG: lysylphosphatidylglycerol synthase transmembrane domain-containing protein [Balneolaceae bacterium]
MRIKSLNILLSVCVAIFFLWLAFRNIDLSELWQQITLVTYYWLPFFIIVLCLSHYLRAERWRLMLPEDCLEIKRSTLFSGVMLGYMVNTIVPRLGEFSRPVYVAKKGNVSPGNLIGTVVAERILDVITMLLLMLFAAIWLVRDLEKVHQLLGLEQWSPVYYLAVPVFIFLLLFAIWLFYRIIFYVDSNLHIQNPVLSKIMSAGKSFGEGLISLKKVKNWPLFIILTIFIWFGYILMVYLPFYMMSMQANFGLNFPDAIVLTVVSSIGVSIPTPAGIGSYHLLIQQSLWVLFSVPLTKALTYATVVHAASILGVFIVGPIAFWWDKALLMRHTKEGIS